jgi:hypothetical protein
VLVERRGDSHKGKEIDEQQDRKEIREKMLHSKALA